MQKYPQAKVKVLVVWTPILRNDSRGAAQQAATYMPDSRVQHFWDLWSYANRSYAHQLGLPVEEAWDLFVLYEPRLKWESGLPSPTVWMQHRNLDKGTPYPQELLESELVKWAR